MSDDNVPEGFKSGKQLLVSEIFGPTIQGEGSQVGKQTIFVRFAGCDYRCSRCDSLFAVLPDLIHKHALRMTSDELIEEIDTITSSSSGRTCNHLTFSGGNPCIRDLDELVYELTYRKGFTIGVETQGTIFQHWLNNPSVHTTVSPKGPGMGEKFDMEVFSRFICQLERIPTIKVVIFDQRDIELCVEILDAHPYLRKDFWVSTGNVLPPAPAQSDLPENEYSHETLVDTVLANTVSLVETIIHDHRMREVRVLPQLHTLLWGNKRGV